MEHIPTVASLACSLGLAIVSYYTMRLRINAAGMDRRLKIVEAAYRDCQEHMQQPWPSDDDEFRQKVRNLKLSMELAGRQCTLEDAARVLRHLKPKPDPA